MQVIINDKEYNVIIERKRIKNTYLRINDNLDIYITTNILVSSKELNKFINNNIKSIEKMINSKEKRIEKSNNFYYLGKIYKPVKLNTIKEVTIDNDYIYYKSINDLNKFLDKQMDIIFKERFDINYNKFEESIPYPKLTYRKMRRKWGYCSKKNVICLNKELIKYSIDDIDYVIIHELCHLVYFDHSKSFWALVSKYKSDYKVNKRSLKE